VRFLLVGRRPEPPPWANPRSSRDAVGAVPKNKESALAVHGDFDSHLQKYSFLTQVEEKTGRKRVEIVGAILAGAFMLLLAGMFNKWLGILMTRLFGFVYPCYKSLKAIESDEKGDDTQWLTYWMVFASFSFIEDILLRFFESYAPIFFLWKIVFLLWCYLPQTKGALLLYEEVVGPKLREAESLIAQQLNGHEKEE